MLVLVGVVVVLLSIFIPYGLKVRETSRRSACNDNLRKVALALSTYAQQNHGAYPSVPYDGARHPNGYVAFSGPDAPSAFGPGSAVRPNDVTASLWLLLRETRNLASYAPPTAAFLCPSAGDSEDKLRDAGAVAAKVTARSNFRSGRNLSYSYCSPFSAAPGFRLNSDALVPKFAVMADRNPGTRGKGDGVTAPGPDADPFTMAAGNSNNHGKAGQNVLYADGHTEWQNTPYCGVGGDNIYTAFAPTPLRERPAKLNDRGVCGPEYGPAHPADSYLVPTDDEMEAADYPPTPASRPATGPTTSPTTNPTSRPVAATPPTTQPTAGR